MASPISRSPSSRSSDESPSPQDLVIAELTAKMASLRPLSPPAQGSQSRPFRALTVSPISPHPAEEKQEPRLRAKTTSQELSWTDVYSHPTLANPRTFLKVLGYARDPNTFPKEGYQDLALRDIASQFKAINTLRNEQDIQTALRSSLNEATLARVRIDLPRLKTILDQLATLP